MEIFQVRVGINSSIYGNIQLSSLQRRFRGRSLRPFSDKIGK
jgi:hypothetical protein